ncbi:MAG: transposase [Planctomycetes bacterium]|nr:transposase [Planctomycetota bacterium]
MGSEPRLARQRNAGRRGGRPQFDRRFESAIRLDLHFDSLVPDGVFTCAPGQARADFHDADELTDAEVARTIRHIHRRVLRQLRRLGKLDDADADAQDPDVLLQLHAAAVQGRTALGPNAGTPDSRPGRGTMHVQFRHGPGSLCADFDGFSLHAAVRVRQGRPDRLEHLIRYVARPPIATERLSMRPGAIASCHRRVLAPRRTPRPSQRRDVRTSPRISRLPPNRNQQAPSRPSPNSNPPMPRRANRPAQTSAPFPMPRENGHVGVGTTSGPSS